MIALQILLALATLQAEVKQLPKDASAKVAKFAELCDARGEQACSDLGGWYFQRGDYEHAGALFTRACDLSKPGSGMCEFCSVRRSSEAAGFAELSVDPAPFPVRQKAIACDRYSSGACFDAASWLVQRDPPLQVRRGIDVLKYGCEKHDARSCSELQRYRSELGERCTPSDPGSCDGARWVAAPRPSAPVAHAMDGLGTPATASTSAAPSGPASRAPVDRCLAALDRAASGSDPKPRLLVQLGCKGIFKNAEFNKAWYAVSGLEQPDEAAELLLQGARESYCREWNAPKPEGCTHPAKLTRSAAPKLRPVFEHILATDFDGEQRKQLEAGFARNWDLLFSKR